MEKPDANGFVTVNWPSKTIPHGGIFHTRVVEPTEAQQKFLKVLLEESKLTIAQRKKSAFKLREDDSQKVECPPQIQVPAIRPRTSRRRSQSEIRESGAFDVEPYIPLKRGEDRERLKDRLANTMTYGDTPEQVPPPEPKIAKPAPKLPTNKERWNELVTQIRERTEWLAEMEYLGQGAEHRDIIMEQIAERMRGLDALGIDSECSSVRSEKSGFSTVRSKDAVQKTKMSKEGSARSETSHHSIKSQEKQRSTRSSVRGRTKEENVASYGKFSPLQYSPRRRV